MLVKVSTRERFHRRKNNDLDEVWAKIRSGDSDALAKLFCLTYSWLFNYGYKIVPREDFIKDAIQELFLNLWKKRDDIDKANYVKSYLFSSLRRIIFRRLEKQKNRKVRNFDYRKNMFEDVCNIEELIIHFEVEKKKKEQLIIAIKSLSGRQKEAIYLKFYNGLSNTEISEVMGINQQSVYNHVSKAISRLQEFVQAN